jgi:hypothetical protein
MPLACQRLQSRQRSGGSPPNGGGCTDDQPHVHWLSNTVPGSGVEALRCRMA